MVKLKVGDSIEIENCFRETPVSKIYLGTMSTEEMARTYYVGKLSTEKARQQVIVKIAKNHIGEKALEKEISFYRGCPQPGRLYLVNDFMDKEDYVVVYDIPDVNLKEVTLMSNLYTNAKISPRTNQWILLDFLRQNLYDYDEDTFLALAPAASFNNFLVYPKCRWLLIYNHACPEDYTNYQSCEQFFMDCSRYFLDWVRPSGEPGDEEYIHLLQNFSTSCFKDADPCDPYYFLQVESTLLKFYDKYWRGYGRPFTYRLNGEDTWRNL